jgi:hypothetical protein
MTAPSNGTEPAKSAEQKEGSTMKKGLGVLAAAALAFAAPAWADDNCSFQGVGYSDGATTCQAGTQYRCDDGEWESLGVQCTPPGPAASLKNCEYSGHTFSSGATSCQANTQFRCMDGLWKSLEIACAPAAPLAGDAPAAIPPRTCMIDGSTVADASTVCKQGVTYLCDNGAWRNIGTPCR